MSTVLKLNAVYNNQPAGVVYVQQVTPVSIVTIHDQDTTVVWNRKTGVCRTNPNLQILNLDAIEKYLEHFSLHKWHGGWKTKHNSRGELVHYDMVPADRFPNLNAWFQSQNVEIIVLNGPNPPRPKRIPHPFEYNGYVYDGPVKVKILPDDTTESLNKRIAEAKARFV